MAKIDVQKSDGIIIRELIDELSEKRMSKEARDIVREIYMILERNKH
jgi:hypothetical protein